MPRESEERPDLIFLERTRRLDDDRLSLLPRLVPRTLLLPESSKSLRKELQESILRTDSESSESSLDSHSMAGKAWMLSSKLRANSPHDSFESTLSLLPRLDPLTPVVLFCSTSKACVAGEYPLNIVAAILLAFSTWDGCVKEVSLKQREKIWQWWFGDRQQSQSRLNEAAYCTDLPPSRFSAALWIGYLSDWGRYKNKDHINE